MSARVRKSGRRETVVGWSRGLFGLPARGDVSSADVKRHHRSAVNVRPLLGPGRDHTDCCPTKSREEEQNKVMATCGRGAGSNPGVREIIPRCLFFFCLSILVVCALRLLRVKKLHNWNICVIKKGHCFKYGSSKVFSTALMFRRFWKLIERVWNS